MSRLWLALLIAASAGLTTAYTCITPFAAFGLRRLVGAAESFRRRRSAQTSPARFA